MVEGERGYLGMTHNPFAQPGEGFFERGSRKAHLEELRHLSQWTQRVLLVTGPQGAGKSVLYRQLSSSLEPRAKAARVNGSLVNTAREILAAIAQGYGVAVASNANSQALLGVIAAHVTEQDAGHRFCVTMIDDAEALEPQAVEELLKLLAACPMRLVLFGEAAIASTVERAAKRQGLDWHEIRLAGFNGQDARDYLEWRFAEAKYRGRLPFTDQQVSEVVRLAEGYPGKMNQLANVLLAKLESGNVRPDRTRFPAVHRALTGLLVLLAALAYLIWYQAREEVEAPQPAAAPEISPELHRAVVQEDLALAPTEDGEATLTEPEPEPGPEPEPSAEARADAAAEPPSSSEAAQGAERREADDTAATTVGSAAAPAAQPHVTPQPRAAAAPWRGEAWLLDQSPEAYTIQLVSVSTQERAAAFLRKQPQPEAFATYQVNRDGQMLHVIVYGVFRTREEAQIAASNLPDSVGSVRPWVRSVEQVQRAISGS